MPAVLHIKNMVCRRCILVVEQVQAGELPEDFSLVKFISATLHRDYSSVSKLFSEVEGITLEQYFILQKIEKVKEWLIYHELTFPLTGRLTFVA